MADIVDMEGKAVSPALVRRGLPLACKQRIVVLFAQFQGLSDVSKAVEAEFGLRLDDRTLAQYDPARPAARIGRRLRELYASARAAWVGEATQIGISHQTQRLRRIERLLDAAERGKDWAAATKLLELAAKECGGILTNVSKVEHAGAVEHRHLSVDDARSELVQRLAAALDGGVLTALPSPAKPLETDDKPEI